MKVALIALYNNREPQISMRNAFKKLGNEGYVEFSWNEEKARNGVNWQDDIVEAVERLQPDISFLQLQNPDSFSEPYLKRIKKASKFACAFTGDVRKPLPLHYVLQGKYLDMTLFTNMHDVNSARELGINAEYLQIGYEDIHYNTQVGIRTGYPKVVFLGNNYNNRFPLSQLRKDMVNRLSSEFPNEFAVYGSNWDGAESLMGKHKKEAEVLRSAEIAINLSHFCYPRYTSDRMFRILGSGTFCLSHSFPQMEKEFTVGKDLDVWENLDELVEKIKYWLNPINLDKRQEIAKNGYNNTINNCTWDARLKDLLNIINNYKNE